MQIVIEIDEEDYNRLKEIPYVFDSLVSRLYNAVKNGTPLPKNHGDLIDRQIAINAFENCIHELGIDDEPYNYGEMALCKTNAPTIIEEVKADE